MTEFHWNLDLPVHLRVWFCKFYCISNTIATLVSNVDSLTIWYQLFFVYRSSMVCIISIFWRHFHIFTPKCDQAPLKTSMKYLIRLHTNWIQILNKFNTPSNWLLILKWGPSFLHDIYDMPLFWSNDLKHGTVKPLHTEQPLDHSFCFEWRVFHLKGVILI